jgi:SAM-dependent methyltransferase
MNDEQTALWNGVAGRAWVDNRELLDLAFEPLSQLLLPAVVPGSEGHVLDVGCGTASMTLAAAARLGARGRALGLDISLPMIEAARAHAARQGSTAELVCADAQSHALEAASFDVILSRFGVMFFEDSVAAFANLRRAARAGGALRFVAWRAPEENPFMTTAERAAAPLLPNIPPRRADAPGQFAFQDPQRVRSILEQSGWCGAEIRPVDVSCSFPSSELVRYFTRLGPLGSVLHEADDETRARIIETLRRAFDSYVQGADVRFVAACWLVTARAPGV